MSYNHGVRVLENPTSLANPILGTAGLQVIFGTAPINMAADPYNSTNKLFQINSFAEAVELLGYSDDFESYTLCQSMMANFKLFNIAPIILCNVLDPAVHKVAVVAAPYAVTDLQAKINVKGLLLNSLVVKNATVTLVKGTDYVTSFDENGYAVITLLSTGSAAAASTLTVNGDKIDPSLVEATDIIGGYDVSTGVEKGLELIRQVYPKFGLTPGLLLAPGWSQLPTVAAVMAAKCTDINGSFSCVCVLDLDTKVATGAQKYTDCENLKEENGYTSKHAIVLWPMVKASGVKLSYSAVYGALVAYTDATSDDVPNLSPSNKLLGVTAAILDDGTEVTLDQQQANVLNGAGIVTALNLNGWRAWGNNMACYPDNIDPKDRWISCRRFFSWWANSFILTYLEKVDSNANYRLIESICDAENIRGNSFVSQGKCAGARIEFRQDDNPISEVLNGKIQFKQYLAPFTPAEDILNVLEFDASMIAAALGGE